MKKKVKPFQVINVLIMLFLIGITLYPMYYVVVASISDPILLKSHTGLLWKPLGEATLAGYQKTLANKSLFNGFKITLFYLIIGTLLQVVLTSFAAYVVSRKCFLIRRGVMKLMIFTMFFSGGLIPLFFVIRNTGLYNTIWVSSIPYAVSAYNMIIMKTFFESIPESLEEAAIIDGANDFYRIFQNHHAPFQAGGGGYDSLLWRRPVELMVSGSHVHKGQENLSLQMILREILIENQAQNADSLIAAVEDTFSSELVKYCTIIVSTIPILIIYPFLQKYFEKGVMIGAVKG